MVQKKAEERTQVSYGWEKGQSRPQGLAGPGDVNLREGSKGKAATREKRAEERSLSMCHDEKGCGTGSGVSQCPQNTV